MKESKRNLLKIVSWTLFIIYLVGMFYFLFFSEHYGRTEELNDYKYNLEFFNEIKRYIRYHKVLGFEFVLVNLFGNVLAFMPFGFCLPIISKNEDKFLRILTASFFFSMMIETIQLIYKIGIFDVDDLFLNTIGGVLGFIAYRSLSYIIIIKSQESKYARKKG